MIQVEDKIISMSIFEKYFVCDLNACKGACCVEGDSGAPLTVKEEKKLNTIYKKVKPYMREEGISEIEKRVWNKHQKKYSICRNSVLSP